MIIPVKTALGGYEIIIERGALGRANELLDLKRKVLVVTDDGVPSKYSGIIADMSQEALTVVIPQGEASKNLNNYKRILEALLGADFTRSDCVVAVGGGVIGDMAGFAAATYMRGIDFYNVPTTVLSQVDSSVGGKTAVDFGGYKNLIGSFFPPKAVIIDPDTLYTLDGRQISNGLAEALKMAATFDRRLFCVFEEGRALSEIENVIASSVMIKKQVVEADERENGLRRALNFGHTLGHAVEVSGAGLLHGECVGIGMLHMCSPGVKNRIEAALGKLNLPIKADIGFERIKNAVLHDKKASGDTITTVFVKNIGDYEFVTEKTEVFLKKIESEWKI